jgi:hypothetical protein
VAIAKVGGRRTLCELVCGKNMMMSLIFLIFSCYNGRLYSVRGTPNLFLTPNWKV